MRGWRCADGAGGGIMGVSCFVGDKQYFFRFLCGSAFVSIVSSNLILFIYVATVERFFCTTRRQLTSNVVCGEKVTTTMKVSVAFRRFLHFSIITETNWNEYSLITFPKENEKRLLIARRSERNGAMGIYRMRDCAMPLIDNQLTDKSVCNAFRFVWRWKPLPASIVISI